MTQIVEDILKRELLTMPFSIMGRRPCVTSDTFALLLYLLSNLFLLVLHILERAAVDTIVLLTLDVLPSLKSLYFV
jgi:hypothetical protein